MTSNPDGIHIDAVSQRKFGLRYFEAFHKKKHILNHLENEEEILKTIYSRPYTKNEKIYMESMDLALGKISYNEFLTQVGKINNN